MFVVVVVAVDAHFVWVVVRTLVGASFGQLQRAYPPVAPAPDAVRRRFQSFRLGLVSCSGSVHVAADEHYLHLEPIAPLRWFGARPCSIPWEAIELQRPGRGRLIPARARVGPVTISGPSWCLELAGPAGQPHGAEPADGTPSPDRDR